MLMKSLFDMKKTRSNAQPYVILLDDAEAEVMVEYGPEKNATKSPQMILLLLVEFCSSPFSDVVKIN